MEDFKPSSAEFLAEVKLLFQHTKVEKVRVHSRSGGRLKVVPRLSRAHAKVKV